MLNRHFPICVRIEDANYDRQPMLPRESYPGVPYACADARALRREIRIEIIECPGCGGPLRMQVESGGSGVEGKKPQFSCGNVNCGRVWKCRTLNESGKAPMLALVMENIR